MRPTLTGYLDLNQTASFDDVLSRAKKLGLDTLALRSYRGQPLLEMNDSDIKKLINELKEHKMKIGLVDTDIKPYDLYDEKKHKDAVDVFKYMLKLADKLKCAYVTLELFRFDDVIEEFETIEKRVMDYVDAAMRGSKKIILVPGSTHKANVFAYIFKKIKSKSLLYLYDPVQLMRNHESTTTAYRLLRQRIGLINAVDADHQDRPMLLGYGKTDILKIFKKLIRDRYDGLISIDNAFHEAVFAETTESKGFIKRLFSKEKKRKQNAMSDLSKKIFPNEETKNVTYDDILENQIKVLEVIFK